MSKTAVLIDGGFYLKKASSALGQKDAPERAKEIWDYCIKHIEKSKEKDREDRYLYRIFYYDCPPLDCANIYHPFHKRNINLKVTDTYKWKIELLEELKKKRKIALRLGELLKEQAYYTLNNGKTLRKLCRKEISIDDLKETDFSLAVRQKGVDMKIGLDIAALAYKKQVDQIVLIAGDSDFVPAAKLARREGIDFILDPLYMPIKANLHEHIDALRTVDDRFKNKRF